MNDFLNAVMTVGSSLGVYALIRENWDSIIAVFGG